MSEIAEHLAAVRERIARVAVAAGRAPDEVTLVAVSKEVDAAAVAAAVAAGQRDFGENRAQELAAKAGVLDAEGLAIRVALHRAAPAQQDQVDRVARVSLWHSVDRLELGAEIARHVPGADVLVQVNIARRGAEGRLRAPAPPRRSSTRSRGSDSPYAGLMTVPPLVGDPRPHFAALRELAARASDSRRCRWA